MDFLETFDSKNSQGKPIALPAGNYRLVLERGGFVREYTPGKGLIKNRTQIVWQIKGTESKSFEFTTMYYTLYVNDTQLARGVLRIQ